MLYLINTYNVICILKNTLKINVVNKEACENCEPLIGCNKNTASLFIT